MPATIKVTKKTKTAMVSLHDPEKLHKSGLRKGWHEAGQLVVKQNRRNITTGTRSGRTYTYRGQRHIASSPLEIPANRSGRLEKSTGYKVRGWSEMEFGERAPYAAFLEEGTRIMRPRVHLTVAVNETAQDVAITLLRAIDRELKK